MKMKRARAKVQSKSAKRKAISGQKGLNEEQEMPWTLLMLLSFAEAKLKSMLRRMEACFRSSTSDQGTGRFDLRQQEGGWL
mmetsp:Transcript_42464/g.92234  ORF Transcript_42464/g.92234 Transcript_42464/m.92234 type:complete len:81 (-) Transcript_42464:294-536(-)